MDPTNVDITLGTYSQSEKEFMSSKNNTNVEAPMIDTWSTGVAHLSWKPNQMFV